MVLLFSAYVDSRQGFGPEGLREDLAKQLLERQGAWSVNHSFLRSLYRFARKINENKVGSKLPHSEPISEQSYVLCRLGQKLVGKAAKLNGSLPNAIFASMFRGFSNACRRAQCHTHAAFATMHCSSSLVPWQLLARMP